MASRRVAAVVRCALIAVGLGSAVSSRGLAQDVLCDNNKEPEVRAVRFEGNATFSDDELSARVLATPSSTLRNWLRVLGRRRCFPDIGLQNDSLNLLTFYRNEGFYDTQVKPSVVTLDPQRVDIVFKITEGQPIILDSLAILGLDSVAERNRILRDSVVKVGRRVGLLLVAAQMDTITQRLHNLGYPKATRPFQSFDIHASEHRAELTLTVEPGVRAKIGTITVRGVGVSGGAAQIDSSVVLGLLGFRSGDVYNETSINDAQRHLYDLAVYRHVDVTVDSTWTHGDSLADILVDVREDYFKQVDTDEGWGQLDCFKVSALYTDKNFQDQARRLDLTARASKLGWAKPAASTSTRHLCDYRLQDDSLASSKVNYYLGSTIRYPTLFGRPFTPALSIYTERQGQYQAYLRETEIGVDLSATRDIARQTPFRLGYTFEHGSTSAEPLVLCAIFSRCTAQEQEDVTRRQRLGIASASVQRTRTDNLVAPTRGYASGVEVRYSAPFLASDEQLRFFKTSGEIALYRTVKSGIVFAARARGGVILGGQATDSTRLPPPQERLYAGGPTTVRGFQQNQLGPQVYLLDDNGVNICPATAVPCTSTDRMTIAQALSSGNPFYIQSNGQRQSRSIPSGGNLLAVFNAELRIRDPFFTNLLEYVPFVDAGQVWITQIQQNVHREKLAVTPGLGVRYYSPVGPIQVNLGYNKYDAIAGVAYYTIPVVNGGAQQSRPLLCVTPQGESPNIITPSGSSLSQGSCASSFHPPGQAGFFRHLNLTLSIGTDF